MRRQTIILSDSVVLDTLSIEPGSQLLRNAQDDIIPDSMYVINFSKSTLYPAHISLLNQPISITYRVFPYNFSKPYPEYPLQINDSQPKPSINYNPTIVHGGYSDDSSSKLQVNGTLSRGLSVGNTQNAVVNSNLNMQLTGELSPGLYIEALLADKNIPIQPDGYTQQIQEFDQVYIRVFDSVRSLQMGDVEINAVHSDFLKFNRKILGGNFMHQHMQFSENTSAKSQVSAAVSKGNYNRIEFQGIEGIQGPYPLTGANNETYIIILAGTEKIYLDGVLLERGENADYVINYNTAELVFTPAHFINKDSRIIAEFEYSDKNYNRFILYTQNEVKHKKGSYFVQYFNEGDAKNQPVNQLLTDEHKHILANAGDDPLKAIVPNFDSIAFNSNLVLYKLVDTVSNGIYYDSVLVYSTNVDSAFYQAGFALVGENRGNYIQVITAANGKVFKWVAPNESIPQGNYEPVQLLIAPQKHQIAIAKTEFSFTDRTHASIELAVSEKNTNTFSADNTASTKGIAIKNFVEHSIPLQTKKVDLSFTYELAQKQFSPVDRYKSAEFNRDWNIFTPFYNDEHFLQATISLSEKKNTRASFVTEHLNYGQFYQGYRNTGFVNLNFYKFAFTGKASILNSAEADANTRFYRHNLKLTRPVWKVVLGAMHDFEDNQQKSSLSDSLTLRSKKYSAAEVFVSNNDSSIQLYSLAFKNRVDFLPFQNKLTPATETNDVVFNTQLGSGKVQQLKTTLIYRELGVKNSTIDVVNTNEKNLLGRIDHQLKFKKNALNFFTFYEIGTGLETRKEFSYIEVAAGQGIYVWVDYNNNNIPELNEFEVSPFPEEANYLKLYTPTNDYIKVYDIKFNETVKLDPSRIWQNEEGYKKFISRFSNTFTFRAQQKHTQNDLLSRISPLPGYVNDTLQMNRNISFRNTLSFNRTHPKFGVDYSYSLQNQKILMQNGFDASESLLHQIKMRWNITSEVLLLNDVGMQSQSYLSDYFTNKNYLIETLENGVTLQWQPTTKFRALLIYNVKNKANQMGTETAQLHEAGPEIKINSPKQGMISGKISIIFNEYSGELNAPVAYTMLEGYQPGENYRWSVNFSRNINKFLRINLSYTGRKPADSEVIHTGQFSASAYF